MNSVYQKSILSKQHFRLVGYTQWHDVAAFYSQKHSNKMLLLLKVKDSIISKYTVFRDVAMQKWRVL